MEHLQRALLGWLSSLPTCRRQSAARQSLQGRWCRREETTGRTSGSGPSRRRCAGVGKISFQCVQCTTPLASHSLACCIGGGKHVRRRPRGGGGFPSRYQRPSSPAVSLLLPDNHSTAQWPPRQPSGEVPRQFERRWAAGRPLAPHSACQRTCARSQQRLRSFVPPPPSRPLIAAAAAHPHTPCLRRHALDLPILIWDCVAEQLSKRDR